LRFFGLLPAVVALLETSGVLIVRVLLLKEKTQYHGLLAAEKGSPVPETPD
jgi:hypothetical protein